MAQDFAPLFRSIWTDEDFRALSMDAQHIYMMLFSHPDRNSAVLSMTLKKWTRLAADLSPDRLDAALAELDIADFIAADDSTEEVLVRSFIRRAKVYRHIRMLANALREVAEIESPRLRAAACRELARLPRLAVPDNPKMKAEAEAAQRRVDEMASPPSPPDGPGQGDVHPMAHPMADGMAHPLAHPTVVVAGAVVGAGAVAPGPQPRNSSMGGSHVSSGPSTTPPLYSDRCKRHGNDPEPDPCGACADVRKANAQQPRHLAAVADAAPCLIHMEDDVDHCRGCAADRKAAG
jgi:hypothetical protein